MSAIYMIDGKPHRPCDCDESVEMCPRGVKRALMTCGFARCMVPAPDVIRSETASRESVIEEVAKHIEAAPLTYFGPDPGGVRDLKFLIVAAIRDMKKGT